MTASNDLRGISPDDAAGARRAGVQPVVASAQAAVADARVEIGEFFHILFSRIRVIVACVFVACCLAVVYVVLTPSVFTATATVIIDPRERPPVGSDQPPVPQNPDLIRTETQVKLLTSETVLRKTIASLDLLNDPDFGKPGFIDRLLSMLRGQSPQAEREKRIQGLVIALGEMASVRRSERTYIFELDVKARSAEKAAILANGIATAYIEDQRDVQDDYIKRQSAWVAERLVDLQIKVQEAENRAQDYRARNGIVGSGGVLVNEQQLTEAAKLLAAARARTAEVRSRHDQVRRLTSAGQTMGALPEALRSTAVEKLRLQTADLRRQESNLRVTFGDRHPALIEAREQIRSVQAQLDAEVRRAAEGTYNELQAAIASEAAVTRQVNDLKAMTTTTNGALVGLRELDREVEANRAIYERFLRARESLRPDVGDPLMARIAARAVPPLRRSSPRPLAALIAALAGGLALGMGVALGLEHRARFKAKATPAGALDSPPVSQALPVDPVETSRLATRLDTFAEDRSSLPMGSAAPRGLDAAKVVDDLQASQDAALLQPGPVAASLPLASASTAGPRSAALARGDAIAVLPRIGENLAMPAAQARWGSQVAPFLEVRFSGQSSFSRAAHDLCKQMLGEFDSDDVVKILITSIEPGVGKSVLAANLAQAAAEAGERVLLIDANSQHPSISALAPHDEPPALIALSGTMRLAYRLWTGSGSLHLIPLSPAEKRLTRRLVRDQSTEFIEGIADNFDLVIVDGPVARAGEEPMALVAAASEIIIVGGEQTAMSDVQPLLRRMRAQAKFRGIVRVEQEEEAQVA